MYKSYGIETESGDEILVVDHQKKDKKALDLLKTRMSLRRKETKSKPKKEK